MLRLFSFVLLAMVVMCNLCVLALMCGIAVISEAKLAWMSEHGMFKHEMAYVFLGVCLLLIGVFALKDGWRLTKQCYEFSKG